MAESIKFPHDGSREEKYHALLPQIESLVAGEADLIANLANTAAAIKEVFDFHWVGFYRNVNGELILGPFQGPVACTRIPAGKGVCGRSVQEKRTIIVPDVEAFPGHIACSSLSKSEIVVPLLYGGEVKLVLDIDSIHLSDFTDIDREQLERIVGILKKKHTI